MIINVTIFWLQRKKIRKVLFLASY